MPHATSVTSVVRNYCLYRVFISSLYLSAGGMVVNGNILCQASFGREGKKHSGFLFCETKARLSRLSSKRAAKVKCVCRK